jgi:DNA-binding transcriptional LysR family regulator
MNQVQSIVIFLRVAELASFSQAARQLGLPNASVSTTVRKLEKMLGTRLLHRTTRHVQLTPDGEAFYERGKSVVADVDDLCTMFQAEAGQISGRLRIDMPSGTARHLVIPHLAEFMRAHPKVRIDLGSADRRVDVAGEGFDCVLRVGQLSASSLVARNLGRIKVISCASPAYLKRHGVPATPHDLAGHRLIEYDPELGARPTGWEWHDGQASRYVAMPSTLTVNNTGTYEAACIAGLGIIQVPVMGIQHLLQSKALCEILPDYLAAPMPVSILYQDRRQVPARVRVFMDWLADLVRRNGLHAQAPGQSSP